MNQKIRFCTAPDGASIAYAVGGDGPPLVKAPNWLTHLEFEWNSPVWRHWWEELARDYSLVRFDQRGSGLSDRVVSEQSFDTWVDDMGPWWTISVSTGSRFSGYLRVAQSQRRTPCETQVASIDS